MKSAEELKQKWIECCEIVSITEFIKQIQFDSIKEGMTRAAEICINEGGTIHTCKQAILHARDNLKELV